MTRAFTLGLACLIGVFVFLVSDYLNLPYGKFNLISSRPQVGIQENEIVNADPRWVNDARLKFVFDKLLNLDTASLIFIKYASNPCPWADIQDCRKPEVIRKMASDILSFKSTQSQMQYVERSAVATESNAVASARNSIIFSLGLAISAVSLVISFYNFFFQWKAARSAEKNKKKGDDDESQLRVVG